MKQKEFYCQSTLKKNGWTDSLIRKFAGDPDKIVPNPHSRNSSPMKLYRIDRINGIEQSADFIFELQKSSARRESRKIVSQRKRIETIEWAKTLPKPQFELKTQSQLIHEACEHYNSLWSFRGKFEKNAAPNDNINFLNRITVNYLRHCCSDYEEYLFDSKGKIGADKARLEIKKLILEHIANSYPFLKNECNRQLSKIESDNDISFASH